MTQVTNIQEVMMSLHETEAWPETLAAFRKAFAPRHGEARRLLAGRSESRHLEAPTLLAWCFRHLPRHFTRPPSQMHLWLLRMLDTMRHDRGVKVNVLGPRGGAKSTIGTLAFPLREALEGRQRYIWIVSDTIPQARAHLENIYTAVRNNHRLRETYPIVLKGLKTDMKHTAGVLEFRNGVRMEALSTGQKIRGRRHGESRPGLIVCDDLQNDSHIRSREQRRKSREWFFGSLMKSGTKATNVVHLATALHQDSLAMELDRTPGWKSRIFRALMRWPSDMELWTQWEAIYATTQTPMAKALARKFYESHKAEMDAGAQLLWEAEEDLYTLMCLRAEGGHAAFEREKQNSPIDPAQCEWGKDYFDDRRLWFDVFPAKATRVMALDPSKGKDASRGDYSAYVMLAVDSDGDMYVDAAMIRVPVEQMIAEGVELYTRFRPDAFGIEGNQFQDLLADLFAKAFQARAIPVPAPWLIHNHVAKETRIRRLGQYLASRRLRFKSDSPGAKLLVEQLRQFPLADHDDGPDALEMAIRLLHEKLGWERFDDGLGDRLPI